MPNLVNGFNIGGIESKGEWATGNIYYEGDVVTRGGSAYETISSHTSGTFETDLAANKWRVLVRGLRWTGDYATSTLYLKDDLVFENYNTYIANSTFTSNSVSFSNDLYWELLARGGFNTVAEQAGNSGKILSTDGSETLWASNISINSVQANTLTSNNVALFSNGFTSTGVSSVQELEETVVPVTLISNTATLNWTSGNIFYVSTGANVSGININITNVPTVDNTAKTVNLFLTQSNTASNINLFQINSVTTAVKYLGGLQAPPTPNSIDVYNYTIITLSNAFTVFGSVTKNFA